MDSQQNHPPADRPHSASYVNASSSSYMTTGTPSGHASPPDSCSAADSVSEKSLHADAQGAQKEAHQILTPQVSRMSQQLSIVSRRISAVNTAGTTDPNFEVDWDGESDPANPHNWSVAYRGMLMGFLSWNTLVV